MSNNAFQSYLSFETLPPPLVNNFNVHAGGGEIDIQGASPGQSTTEAQLLFLENLCSATDVAIYNALNPAAGTATTIPIIPTATAAPTTTTSIGDGTTGGVGLTPAPSASSTLGSTTGGVPTISTVVPGIMTMLPTTPISTSPGVPGGTVIPTNTSASTDIPGETPTMPTISTPAGPGPSTMGPTLDLNNCKLRMAIADNDRNNLLNQAGKTLENGRFF